MPARSVPSSLRAWPAAVAALLAALVTVACGGQELVEEKAPATAEEQEERQQILSATVEAPAPPTGATVAASLKAPASVCFFEQPNFVGRSFCASADGAAMPTGFDNNVSSIRVPDGLKVELFELIGHTGRSISLTADTARLATPAFDNLTSAFRIAPTGSSWPQADTFYWSNPATWGGTKPPAGAAVVVPAGMNLVLDETTASLGPVTIEGTLRWRDAVTAELRARSIVVRGSGALLAGSATERFKGLATVTLTDTVTTADPTGMGMGTRGLLIHGGGRVELFGNPPPLAWTRLGADAAAGATAITLAASPGWKRNDQIVIAPTEWYPVNQWATQAEHDAAAPTERRTVSTVTGSKLTVTAAVSAFKWGSLQYLTDAGLSLVPGSFTAPHPEAVSRIDERAEVGNLTRNIVIQGVNDALWTGKGFGGQVMVMDLSSMLRLDGVELRRVGQAGVLGRYPIHWHLLSYAADGSWLGDAAGHFVRNSTVWDSRQRCMVIHGTNGVELRNNICFDIKGHAIFLEDAVERRNVIEGNLVLRVRSPADNLLTALHEQRASAGGCGGASAGYWLTNPDNTVRNNAVADAQGNGFWLSYPKTPKKQGAKVPILPAHLAHAPFEFNSARANGHFGVMLECALADDAGRTEVAKYAPTVDGQPFNYNNGKRFELRGLTIAKNRTGGYANRTNVPDYRQFVVTGNLQRSVTGAVDAGTIKHSVIAAHTLNNRQSPPAGFDPQLGIASYHSLMDIAENTFFNFENKGYVLGSPGWDKSSGSFGTDDYYVRPVEKGYFRNAGNRLINSDPGYRALPPHLQPNYTLASRSHWTLSGAIWDPQGIVGAAGRYWVLDHAFLREPSCTSVLTRLPAGKPNGLSCAGPFYGIEGIWLNRNLPGATGQWGLYEKIEVTRQTAAGAEVGRWVVEAGHTSTFLGNMRHFAAVKGDSYILRFPLFPNDAATKAPPSWVQFNVENVREPGDSLMIGVHYAGKAVPSRVFFSTNPDYARFSGPTQDSRLLTQAASRAAVAAGAGNLYWQDTANNLVWIKLTPLGLSAPWTSVAAGSDGDLYRGYRVRIEP